MSLTASLIVTALKLLANFIEIYRNRQLLDAGQDRAIAEAATDLLLKTQSAKDILAEVTSLTDEQVDKALKDLEP